MPYNAPGKNAALSGGLSNAITFIGVLQNGEPGTGTNFTGTEATGGSPAYARKAVTWGAAASGQISNSGAITFDVAAGTYSDFVLMNNVSTNTNNYFGFAPINGTIRQYGTVDSTGVTNDTITSPAHGLAAGDQVRVYPVFALSLPTSTSSLLAANTRLFVIATGLTSDVFKLSTTSGGAAIDITGVGELFFQKVIPEQFNAQGQITLAIGALVLDATAM